MISTAYLKSVKIYISNDGYLVSHEISYDHLNFTVYKYVYFIKMLC